MQTTSSNVTSPYFQDNQQLLLDARDITKDIISGLSISLGGIESPTTKLSSLNSIPQKDYTWSLG